VELKSAEREINVRGVFEPERHLIEGRDLLLIDDVRTTGATLNAAADVLLSAGAKSVSAYCLAGVEADSDHTDRAGEY
jgi:predicted amidophosphoribosyltransferase